MFMGSPTGIDPQQQFYENSTILCFSLKNPVQKPLVAFVSMASNVVPRTKFVHAEIAPGRLGATSCAYFEFGMQSEGPHVQRLAMHHCNRPTPSTVCFSGCSTGVYAVEESKRKAEGSATSPFAS